MEYKINLDDGEFFNATIYKDGREVATVYDKDLVSLITAAPSLLEALKECANRIEINMKHTEDLIAHMKAEEAIAKALGDTMAFNYLAQGGG